MELSNALQMLSAYTGLVASVFFALGMITQDTSAMLDMSQAYWGYNPTTMKSLSSQKADYLIGFSLLILTFLLQILSYSAPNLISVNIQISQTQAALLLLPLFALIFIILLILSKLLAKSFRNKIVKLSVKLEQERLGQASTEQP
ncbi:hypothetical protein [Stutzerimonas stutzeri]|uniref:hypothetical protein n=1 Tax=Stutzerimonas stutzeri TaxID=316 RepID=UPI00126741AA|nr:hypothetical protein [Stutzerimonas stutzeri]UVO18295.1 hypothetical protein KN217_00875 [Stutzerimonas stutzeri]